jgi:hypothetical protein
VCDLDGGFTESHIRALALTHSLTHTHTQTHTQEEGVTALERIAPSASLSEDPSTIPGLCGALEKVLDGMPEPSACKRRAILHRYVAAII